MKASRTNEGFTLVELMVVVLIIGILVAIAIPVFNAATASASLRSCQSNQRTIEGACEQWVTAGNARATLAGSVDGSHILITGNYVKSVPKCPTATAAQFYTLDASSTVSCPSTPPHAHYGS